MPVAALALLIAVAGGTVAALPAMLQSRGDSDCGEWRACRQLALDAAEREEYERFHDLAWRAVQTGPPKDPSLMYLLARAQALSGRPRDALMMLQRLAAMGVASDAATDKDFDRVRQLPEWPGVEAGLLAPVRAAPPAATSSAAAGLAVLALAPPTRTVRFTTKRFAVSGLAYDAPSRRFVVGDRLGRKLMVVDEGSSQTVDLVRADSAGFLDISAVEIDATRGDLWVASGAPADGAGTLHRLQLVSGRPLRAIKAGAGLGPVQFVDLAVGPAGAILVLDALTPQLLVLRPGGTVLERVVRIDAAEAVSVAVRADDGIAFVAHRDGVSRIDLRSRAVSRVSASNGVSLGRLERIRWRGNALIAVQLDGADSRHLVRLQMNARGSSITRATRLEVQAPIAGQTFATLSGNELVYVKAGADDAGGRSTPGAVSSPAEAEFVAYRVPLP